jgi:hypothetical protein
MAARSLAHDRRGGVGMTLQWPDEVRFERKRFSVTAVDGVGLFDPTAHGLEPRWLGTGCYRGHVCLYSVVRRRLVLRELIVGAENEPVRLGGVRPRLDERDGWRYAGLDVPVDFTGRLLLGGGDRYSYYLNMGFWPAWMYYDVRDLTFQDGALRAAVDCSDELAEVREVVLDLGVGPDEGEPSGDWIDRTFSLDYDYSWPGRSTAWPPPAARRRLEA